MHFFGLGYQETLDLPLDAFWLLSNNVNRLGAEKDIRSLSVVAGAQSEKGFRKTHDGLQQEMGSIISKKVDEKEGLERLRALTARIAGGR